MLSGIETTASFHSSSPCLSPCEGRSPPLPTEMTLPWLPAGPPGPQTPRTSAGPTTSPRSSSPGDAHSGTLCQRAQSKMEELKERRTMTAKSLNDVPGPSLFSSRHLNRAYSSPLLSTPASRPTRATYAPLFASPKTPSPFPPTRLRQSSAPSARAPACTSPLSCPRLRPVARACRLLRHPSLQHAACCAPTAATSHLLFCLL